MPTKQFYTVTEVSELLAVPPSTLRYWEDVFPLFNPNRLPSGRRRFTPSDVKTAEKIKELLYVKGMTVDGAIIEMNKTHRISRPHPPRPCNTAERAIVLLNEAIGFIENQHAISKIKPVLKYLKKIQDAEKRAD